MSLGLNFVSKGSGLTQAKTGRDAASHPVGRRAWVSLIVVGLVGSIAFTVEGMYLNLFVYNTISTDPHLLATMVAASAVAATVGTLLFGALSDRLGRRRAFIALGFVLWGVAMAAFGFVSVDRVEGILAVSDAVIATMLVMILVNCLVSFFGSGAFSAPFMAWVTDVTDRGNRGRVETVLVVFPPLSILIALAALDGLARAEHWRALFLLAGGVMCLAGVVAWFVVRDAPALEPQRDGLLRALVHGLRPSTVRRNPRLYLALVAYAVLGISTQIFLPYLLIYIQHYLKLEGYALLVGIALLGASTLSILGGRVIDRLGKRAVLLPAAAIYAIGLVWMFLARETVPVVLAGIVVMTGYMLLLGTIGGLVRDYTPPDRVGSVQGVRTVLASLPPSLLGPFIGAAVIAGNSHYYQELGVLKNVPTPDIFLAAAITLALVIVPVLFLRRAEARVAAR